MANGKLLAKYFQGWINKVSMRNIFIIMLLVASFKAVAQDVKPFIPPPDAKYYDFWPGTWYRIVNDKVDTNSTRFIVTQNIHSAAWYEEWRMSIDSVTTLKATALRAWDKTNNRWMYTWVSDNGLYQVWEGRKVDSNWYIYKEFNINGDKYLSRQAWIPEGPNKLMRTSEKSYDNGATWQLRFKEYYMKLP
jgi:hypothetical protein